ncbi:hypothetical protein BJV85_001842 [Clostridium acetobutylicum]|uniref:Uncharacterized protein n=1 Tax=Clostridium acetobutylicum (strain ATCC 824 / DSM 792 / JCM 1419 / IAM 19013 / LMG 5710 / NBRC 13948 / NRRL B-527 / VKM B-1787 / 2291 / W) TaxID=272562 RepID=Q97HH6_CLOAB|nr:MULTISPECIES: hypothetical protein [Clostridium]AAK79994.1 Hypothetical protein, CF-23 family [Clostridium acetobutylicum ATCC 824]ADZ21086.1 conserved hypothetical protein [Clostridium acetobutylicum EA 2018]AEI32142.1 hypothetical protein SMB_G2067 [Clostridium acetobutylicum DSM 1731]AWV79576.1 hypothetical protein DK921_05570 [Clostridium acetobutylicum]MBC2394450.1 hypothetical protein [Clostridium acetobutylicum]
MKYSIYKGKLYLSSIRNMKVRLRSRVYEEGFKELVDLLGNIHNDIFIKEVTIEDVDIIYNIEYKVIYKGREFIPWAVGKFILDTGKITLGTNDEKEARLYNFKKVEQFVFKKEVEIEEVDALIEIKKPILKFESMGEQVTRIEPKYIKDYLKKLLE